MSGEAVTPRFLKGAAALAVAGVCLAALGIILVCLTTFGGVRIETVTFDTAGYDSPPRKVSGLLFIPDEPVAIPTPGVVFSHGLLMSKELHLEQCRSLAAEGLVVLAIDLRGHGATGGSNDAGLTERRDVWAAVEYLGGVPGVDRERIAVGGHSLGSIASTTAGIFQEGDRIKTVVAIAGQPGREEAAQLLFGKTSDFLGKIWPFLGWSRQWDINSAADLADRNIVNDITGDRPPNYLLVVGDRDSALPVEAAETMMESATGRAHVQAGRTYGSFTDGTARRLEVTEDTHTSEAFSEAVWNDFAGWVFQSFDLPPPGLLQMRPRLRYLGQFLLVLGFFLIGMGALYLLRYMFERTRPVEDVSPFRPGNPRAARRLAVMSVLLFMVISFLSFPFSKATGVRAFVPLLGADLYASLAASRTLLLIGVAALVLGATAIRGLDPVYCSSEGALQPGGTGSSVLAGVVTLAVFMFLYVPTAHGLYLNGGVPVSLWGFFTFAGVVTVQLYIEQEYFHYFLLPAFSPRDTGKKRFTYVLCESAVRGTAFGLAFLPLIATPFYLVGRTGEVRLPVIPMAMIAGFLLFLPVSALGLYTRRRGYSVIASSLFLALAASVIAGCLFAVRVF